MNSVTYMRVALYVILMALSLQQKDFYTENSAHMCKVALEKKGTAIMSFDTNMQYNAARGRE